MTETLHPPKSMTLYRYAEDAHERFEAAREATPLGDVVRRHALFQWIEHTFKDSFSAEDVFLVGRQVIAPWLCSDLETVKADLDELVADGILLGHTAP